MASPSPVAVIPTDNKGRIKYFLDADGPNCQDNDIFAGWLDQNGFTTVMKPGACPNGKEAYDSPSAGDKSASSALPYIMCSPKGLDTGLTSGYHAARGNYINCTQSKGAETAGNVFVIVIVVILAVVLLAAAYFWFKYRYLMPFSTSTFPTSAPR